MKLAKMDWKQVTAIENADKIEYPMQVKIFPNRVEISFHNGKEKLPFLFRVGIEGNNPCFVSLPHYLEYSRATCQLPDELKSLVLDIRNIGVKRAENMFYIREYWKMAKRA